MCSILTSQRRKKELFEALNYTQPSFRRRGDIKSRFLDDCRCNVGKEHASAFLLCIFQRIRWYFLSLPSVCLYYLFRWPRFTSFSFIFLLLAIKIYVSM